MNTSAQNGASKASNVKVPVVDLPEQVIVNSCVVDQTYIDEHSPDTSCITFLNNYNVENKQKDSARAITMPSTSHDDAVQPQRMISCGIMSDDDGLPPTRERFIQTSISKFCDTGVQCNMEIEEWEETELLHNCEEINSNEAMVLELQEFNKFIEEKTFTFGNGSRECLICGEITKNRESLQDHMAFHWGPSALCCRCGVEFENLQQLNVHACTDKPGKGRRRYACPHYLCNVVAMSPLELYDHINEHTKYEHYLCAGCWKTSTTASELRAHCKMSVMCQRAVQPELFRYWGLQTNADSVVRKRIILRLNTKNKILIQKVPLILNQKDSHYRQCSVCRGRFFKGSSYNKHVQCCVQKHRKRMKRTDK